MNCTPHELLESEKMLIDRLTSLLVDGSGSGVEDIREQMRISGLAICDSRDAPPCFKGDDWSQGDLDAAMKAFRELNKLAKTNDDDKAVSIFLDSSRDNFPEIPSSKIGRIADAWRRRRIALGCYLPKENAILIFPDVISVVSEEIGVDSKDLAGVVLVHEIGHWMHRHIVTDWPPPGVYASHTDELKECIAQLVCKLLSDSVADDCARNEHDDLIVRFYQAFTLLLPGQPEVYRAFEPFVGMHPSEFLPVLVKLRTIQGCGVFEFEKALEGVSG